MLHSEKLELPSTIPKRFKLQLSERFLFDACAPRWLSGAHAVVVPRLGVGSKHRRFHVFLLAMLGQLLDVKRSFCCPRDDA